MIKKIYIAGKVTGLPPQEVKEKFATAQGIIEKLGFEAVNPIEVVNNPNENWHIAMEKCLVALAQCDAIYMLPCFKDSPGADIEHKKAYALGLDVYYSFEMIE
jgi:hypothetical protein